MAPPLFIFLLWCLHWTHSAAVPLEIVLAHCKEETSWIQNIGYESITLSYDKCNDATGAGIHMAQPNNGREAGTYLQHIVDRYDRLADWTVFSQAERPTYGYRGHRLGGGHLMSNVRFQDYVEAAKTANEQPLFFVFSNALVMTNDNFYQCIRDRYGEAFTGSPSSDLNSSRMCGDGVEWKTWYAFPAWFKAMLEILMQEQHSPVSIKALKGVHEVFGIQPNVNVLFFSQGARFAASKTAIQSRPKSFYANLLAYVNYPDPWAGYFLEWMWFYVLGGSSQPCGFEDAVYNGFQQWMQQSGRHMVTLDISGVDVPGTNVSLTGRNNLTQDIRPAPGQSVVFEAGSVTDFSPAPISITSNDTSAAVILEPGTVWNLPGPLTVDMPMIATNATFNIQPGGTMQFTKGPGALTGVTITCGDGGEAVWVNALGTPIEFQGSIIACPLFTGQSSTARRRNDRRSTNLCGSSSTQAVVTDGGAIQINPKCELPKNANRPKPPRPGRRSADTLNEEGERDLSNAIGVLRHTDDSLLVISDISSGILPTMISSWDDPAGMQLAVSTAQTTPFSETIILYGKTGPCTTTWQTTFDNCPSGFTCSVTGSDSPSDPTLCQVVYSQDVSSTETDDAPAAVEDDGSDEGLFGLLALLALIPICLLIAAGAFWYKNRAQPELESNAARQVPNVQSPTATPDYYPAYEPYGAYYPVEDNAWITPTPVSNLSSAYYYPA